MKIGDDSGACSASYVRLEQISLHLCESLQKVFDLRYCRGLYEAIRIQRIVKQTVRKSELTSVLLAARSLRSYSFDLIYSKLELFRSSSECLFDMLWRGSVILWFLQNCVFIQVYADWLLRLPRSVTGLGNVQCDCTAQATTSLDNGPGVRPMRNSRCAGVSHQFACGSTLRRPS
jgi:hypothetical protein